MKSICTLLLLAAFLLLQANRWTLYMGCRIQNMYSTSNCDCTPLLAVPDAPAGEEHDAAYTHWHPDDFFYPVAKPVMAIIPFKLYGINFHSVETASGYLLSRFKPPAVCPMLVA
jgi:hypothetical protein